ncbi:MAG: hypothetical protein ACK5LS_00935 [Propioniciclava sp.]
MGDGSMVRRIGTALALLGAVGVIAGGVLMGTFFGQLGEITGGRQKYPERPFQLLLAEGQVRTFVSTEDHRCTAILPDRQVLPLPGGRANFTLNDDTFFVAGPLEATIGGTYVVSCSAPVWVSEQKGLGVGRFVGGLLLVIFGVFALIGGVLLMMGVNRKPLSRAAAGPQQHGSHQQPPLHPQHGPRSSPWQPPMSPPSFPEEPPPLPPQVRPRTDPLGRPSADPTQR